MTARLTPARTEEVCRLLDGWRSPPPLTWDALIAAVEGRFGVRYTRQALSAHERIAVAYRTRKNVLRNAPPNQLHGGAEVRAAMERVAVLEAQVARLEAENRILSEQFVRWAYNAGTRGLGPDLLDRPLMSVDREATRNLAVLDGRRRR